LRRHFVKHAFKSGCCVLPEEQHKTRTRAKSDTKRKKPYYVGLDGEGKGRGPHIYTLLAWSDKTGKRRNCVANPTGLSTKECLDFILALPLAARAFGYSLGYDWTKILKDLPAEALYLLVRPHLRQGKRGPKKILWQGYALNMLGTKFTVQHIQSGRRRTVWDIWKFFQGKFVAALENWQVPGELERMREMKEKRAHFDKESDSEVREYCLEECRCMADLAERLDLAHDAAGLSLTSYFGAGSTASVLLGRFDIASKRGTSPDAMKVPIASAFFGGRFEHSVIGPIPGPVFSYDISSAYPYQLCGLPCLEHAVWRHTLKRQTMANARHALVRYSLRDSGITSWGPFPFRLEDGAITFPAESGGGWIWRDEFLAGERLFNVEFREAWCLESDCDCPSPFADIPSIYLERLKLGKDAAGIVLKLGMNSVYGKLAQSVGRAQFQSWIWAGMVTSGTRAMILDFLGLHSDFGNMLMIATDGIYTLERIATPKPRDTGTFHAKKPLGGWEEKILQRGVFAARPGIYFPLDPTPDDLASFRARGLSKAVLVREHAHICQRWEDGCEDVIVPSVTRFVGLKSGTGHSETEGYKVHPSCGEWVEREIRLSFSPLPKRGGIESDRRTLTIRRFPNQTSLPYRKSLISAEAAELRQAEIEASEQPDGGDLTEYL
jgi:hypothetical protein